MALLLLLLLLMKKMMMKMMMVVVLVSAVCLLLVKLGLQASSEHLVFLQLHQANRGLLIVTDDDLFRRRC